MSSSEVGIAVSAGIDVTEAELIAQTSWRRQEKTEMVGAWKAKVYDMHHVQVSYSRHAQDYSPNFSCVCKFMIVFNDLKLLTII